MNKYSVLIYPSIHSSANETLQPLKCPGSNLNVSCIWIFSHQHFRAGTALKTAHTTTVKLFNNEVTLFIEKCHHRIHDSWQGSSWAGSLQFQRYAGTWRRAYCLPSFLWQEGYGLVVFLMSFISLYTEIFLDSKLKLDKCFYPSCYVGVGSDSLCFALMLCRPCTKVFIPWASWASRVSTDMGMETSDNS